MKKLALASFALAFACTTENPNATSGGTDSSTGSTTDSTTSTTGTSTGSTGGCTPGDDGCACDADGNCGAGLSCVADVCGPPECGNGVMEAGEECDDGMNNANEAPCKLDCSSQACGDGFVGPREGCDDGNTEDLDACSNACVPAECGDAIVQMGELCDDGNLVETDACLSTCADATCGDGFVWEGTEQCDDGNRDDTDGCDARCNYAPLCADGIPVATELCYLDAMKIATGAGPTGVLIADVTNDGVNDLVVASATDHNVRVFRGDGLGGLVSDGDYPVGMFAQSVAAGDVDGDGKVDLVVTARNDDKTVVMFSIQQDPMDPAAFQNEDIAAIGGAPTSVAVRDVNGDDRDDVFVVESTLDGFNCWNTTLHQGNANKTLSVLSTASNCDALASGQNGVIGDFKGNGTDLQFIVTRENLDRLDILTGYDQATMMITPMPLGASEEPQLLSVADVDADMKDDLVAPIWDAIECDYQSDIDACTGDEVWIFGGNATTTIDAVPQVVTTTAKGAIASATADFTIDGSQDVVVVSQWDAEITILVNDGLGVLAEQLALPTMGTQPSFVAAGDLNGDTVPDIAATNLFSDDVSVFFSNP